MKKNLTKKLVLALMSIIGITSYSNAQITAGDIVILGVNSDPIDPTNDPLYNELTIGTLVAIPSGQTIFISDYPYTGTALDSTGPSTSEGYIKFTTTSTIPQGTVIKITINGNHIIGGGLSAFGNITAKGWDIDINTDGTGDALSSGGDNWFVFTGSLKSPNFIYGFGNWSTTSLSVNWMTSGTPSTTTSYLPSTLINGLTANLQTQANVNHADNNVFSGNKTNTKYNLLTSITTPANWTKSESVVQDITPGGAVLSGTNPILTILPTEITINENITSFSSCTGSASSTQSFVISATGLSENIVINAPSGFEISKTNNGSGFALSQTLTHSNGIISSTDIYVRISANASGSVNGNITATSLWAPNKSIAVSGVVNTIPSAPFLTSEPICGIGTVTFAQAATRLNIPVSPFKLYDASENGKVVGDGLTTPTISQSTEFYATNTVNGCESPRVKVSAIVNQPSTGSFSETACDKYFFNGLNLTISGAYKDTLVNAVGCDSILTLNLTINTTPTPVLTSEPICGEGTVTFNKLDSRLNGHASIYKLYDAAVNGNIVGNGLTTPSISQTTDYYATYTLNGCESPRTKVTASVNPLPVIKANATPSRSINLGNEVTLFGSGAKSYVWDNNVVNNVAFKPTIKTLYTVTGIDANNCSDTDTITIDVQTTTGVDISTENQFNVYPNPANEYLNISLIGNKNRIISITDLNGKQVFNSTINSEFIAINTKELVSGVYILKIQTAENSVSKQILISK